MDRESFTRDDFELIEQTTEWRGFFEVRSLQLRHRLFAGGWSGTIRRELFVRGSSVGVLPYDPQADAVAILEQFRVGPVLHHGSPWLLELVAGVVEQGETAADVAHREADEEAGLTIRALEPVAEYFSSPGGSDEYFYLYCGHADLSKAGGLHGLDEENEDIRVTVVSFHEAMEMADGGDIRNAPTLIALNWLDRHRERLRRLWR